MADSKIRGFVPARTLHGGTDFPTTRRATRGKNDRDVYAGDVVFFDASGGIQTYHDAVSGQLTSRLPIGVVARVMNADQRPFTFNQPGAGPRIPASTTGFADVYEDPDIIYQVNASATATFLNLSNFGAIRVCAANTAAGRSGQSFDVRTVVTAVGEVTKLYNIVPSTGDEVRVCGEANNDVEVLIVNHQWRNPFWSDIAGAVADVSSLTD